MNIHPQIIHKGKEAEFVVLPIEEYQELINTLEDYEDIKEVKEYLNNPTETFPMSVVLALSNGENSIKVYRKHRKFTQEELAKKVNITKQYISQIEKGERIGTKKVLISIANALNVNISDIT